MLSKEYNTNVITVLDERRVVVDRHLALVAKIKMKIKPMNIENAENKIEKT